MGICTSCLKRTKERIYTSKRPQEERQPLLGSSPTNNDTDTESQYTKKIAGVLGALRAGKLPTTDQLNNGIRVMLGRLRSALEEGEGDDFGFLDDSQRSRPNVRDIISDRKLGGVNERGTKVVRDVRALLEVVGEVGLEKNSMYAIYFRFFLFSFDFDFFIGIMFCEEVGDDDDDCLLI